jgi:hypothetical protein
MTPTTEALRQVFRRELRLRHAAGSSTDANTVAAAAVASYEGLAQHVARIIGGAGVNAIFERSMYLTQKDFPWLSHQPHEGAVESPVQQLRLNLNGQDSSAVALAAEALTVNFADLLVALIGDQLTIRLFRDAWPEGFNADSRPEAIE